MTLSKTMLDRQQTATLYETLREAGMRPGTAEAKAALLTQCLEAFDGAGAEAYLTYAPGRIEFLGKHTDYAGGRSLVTAVDLGFTCVARPRADRTIRLRDVGRRLDFEFSLDAVPETAAQSWTVYPLSAGRRLVRNFPGPLRGADLAFTSDLPPASGLSSSSAFVIALFESLAAVNNIKEHEAYRANIHSPEDLAGYVATYENGQSFGSLLGELGVGTFGGSEDHTAILCSRPGCLVQYRYCPVAYERTIRMPDGLAFVIGVSGVVADKNSPVTQEKYNRKSRLAAHLAQLWRQGTGRAEPHLGAILETSPAALATLEVMVRRSPETPYPHEELLDRLHQFDTENHQIVEPAGLALERGDLAELGRLVDRSQDLAERWLRTQVPETIHLARSARELGVHAASSFGAGFGGAVWALVDEPKAEAFAQEWRERYIRAYPQLAQRAAFRTAQPGPAAFTRPLAL